MEKKLNNDALTEHKNQQNKNLPTDKIEKEYIDSGVSFNAVLNKNKRLMLKEQDDLGYTTSIVSQIKEKNEKKAKRNTIILFVVVGFMIVAFLLLFIFVPQFSKTITL